MLRDLLAGSDYSVIEAADGAAGIAMAKSEHPYLILMDIQMPVIDGYEATRRIKADPAIKGLPIIAVGSFAMKGDEEKARSAGCDHYVTKPYSPMQLLQVFRGLLGPRVGIANWERVVRRQARRDERHEPLMARPVGPSAQCPSVGRPLRRHWAMSGMRGCVPHFCPPTR